MGSDPVTTYLEDLARLLARKLPVKAVMEIIAETEAHLRRTVEELGGTPDAEKDAVARFGDVRAVAADIVAAKTKHQRRLGWWAYSFIASTPTWPLIGAILFSEQNDLQPWLYLTFVVGLPAVSLVAFAVACFKSRSVQFKALLGGWVTAMLGFSLALSYVFIAQYPDSGNGLYLRLQAPSIMRDLTADLVRLRPQVDLCERADLYYNRGGRAYESTFHHEKAYIVPAVRENGYRDNNLAPRLETEEASSFQAAKRLWNQSPGRGAIDSRYRTEEDELHALESGIRCPPLSQFKGLLWNAIPAGLCFLGFIIVAALTSWLAGSIVDNIRGRRMEVA